jgi:hypothetical protein
VAPRNLSLYGGFAPGVRAPSSTEYEAGWASEPVRRLSAPAGSRTTVRQTLVTLLAELYGLLLGFLKCEITSVIISMETLYTVLSLITTVLHA